MDGRCVKRAGGRTRPTACAPSTDLAEARGDETWQSTDPTSTPQPVNARTVTRTRQTRKPRANRLPHAIATRRARRYRGRQVYLALAAEVEDTHELELRPMFQPCFSRVNTSPLRCCCCCCSPSCCCCGLATGRTGVGARVHVRACTDREEAEGARRRTERRELVTRRGRSPRTFEREGSST